MTKQEILDVASGRADYIADLYLAELKRLIGRIDDDEFLHAGLIIGVVLQNIAESYLRNETSTKLYKRLSSL